MNEILHLYKKRLVKEAVIKSLVCGLVVALAALAVCSVVFWFTDFKHVWLGAIVFAAVWGGALPFFYFVFFRPTERQTAKRIDKEMGLDERMVTLLEFKDSEETLACAQRANTVSILRNFGTSGVKKIALKVFSMAIVVTLSAVAALGLGTTAVSALAAADVLPSGAELLRGEPALPAEYTITYAVDGAGIILGLTGETDESGVVLYKQTVTAGEDAKVIWAIAGETEEEGEYFFAGWSDGFADPCRTDKAVSEDLFLVATFLPVGDAEFEPETDMTNELPSPPQGGDGSITVPKPSPDDNGDKEEEGGDGDLEGDGEGGGGSTNPAHQVNDGQTDYGGSTYENAYEEAQQEISSSDNIPEDLIGIIEDYADIIRR